jgi:hypothetical protein
MGQRAVGFAGIYGLHLAMDGTVPVALVEGGGDDLRVVRGFNF